MPRLRRLSGNAVKEIFKSFGFKEISQKGSHAKLRRISSSGKKETLTIPLHNELDTGTLRAIVRQASSYISDDDLQVFYSE